MTLAGMIFGWIFTIVFGLLTVSMIMIQNWLQAFILLVIVLLCLPPVSSFIETQYDRTIHPALRIGVILVLLFVFSRTLLGGEITSIYESPEVKAQFMDIYDQKMTEWPVPYEDIYLDTEYGVIHVIASGPKDAPAMMLLHASGVSSWSWKFNVEELSQNYRTYAIDTLADVGKSEYKDLNHVLETVKDQADLYANIADQLGITKTYVVGASDGGSIASHFAIHYPERIEKVVLMGPMGYAGATQSIIRIMFAQFFPLKPVQKATFKWAFSDSEVLINEFTEWFTLTLTGYTGGVIRVSPSMLSAEERQSIEVPVLFIFGTRDNLVGDPQAAKELVQDIPDVQVEIVEAGHLMGGEAPEECNQLILDFFAKP